MSEFEKGRARPPAEPSEIPHRKSLGHEVPPWVETGQTFFITVCVEDRSAKSLLAPQTAAGLIASVAFLHDRGEWFARLFLVMPDHVHGLLSFPADCDFAHQISAWKGYTAKTLGIRWQTRFFDHRLRCDESQDEKAAYIRMNPVRAKLVHSPEEWPYVFDAFTARRGRLALP